MIAETIPQLKTLPLDKKRRLIAELLDEVFGEPVRERALTARVAHFRQHPGSARSWASVKNRLRRKK
jgi:hypothetical protein